MKNKNRHEVYQEPDRVEKRRLSLHIPHIFYRPVVRLVTIVMVCIVIASVVVILRSNKSSKETTSIISTSSLQSILEISDLSTYKSVYNGVANVKNTSGDKVLYYVSYESEVKVGFDADDIGVEVDDENKTVIITLPDIVINDVSVKMESLDYIFEDDSANTANVSNEAYQACIEDVKTESAANEQIFALAKENSENLIRALIEPLLTQTQDTYTLEIN